MLESLKLRDVGPIPNLEMEFASRLNVITGDNGLGKSFLLDVAWWSLTRTWARGIVLPNSYPAKPEIIYRLWGKSESLSSPFNRDSQQWQIRRGRPQMPGLILYTQYDGGFSIWDPARNYWKKEEPERPSFYSFQSKEVWEGNSHCEGLIRDWASWQRENSEAFGQLKRVLHALSPSKKERLEVGDLQRVFLNDAKAYPSLKMPYGQEVPVIHCSAGMRSIIAMAYLLVWAWQEHLVASKIRGQEPTKEIVFLIDEVEAHLHPQWQRRIVPALLDVMEAMTGEKDFNIQLIVATHSPLVLASLETHFDPKQDAWFDLDFVEEERRVELTQRPLLRLGDTSNWLTSEAFDLKQPTSIEREEAITRALALFRTPSPSQSEILEVENLLKGSLSEIDSLWMSWRQFRRDHKP